MQKNTMVLTVVTVFLLSVSGFLFYQGLSPEFEKQPIKSNDQVKVSPSSNILGERAATGSSQPNSNQARVLKVVDGDTIEVEISGVIRKLRYIGVNTPETVDPRRPVQCFGKEASNENKRLLEGKIVVLEKDISETDKYSRLLRYVYLKLDDGSTLFVNDYLVRQGFAQVNTYPPDVKYADRFKAAEKEARENGRGLWSKCK